MKETKKVACNSKQLYSLFESATCYLSKLIFSNNRNDLIRAKKNADMLKRQKEHLASEEIYQGLNDSDVKGAA